MNINDRASSLVTSVLTSVPGVVPGEFQASFPHYRVSEETRSRWVSLECQISRNRIEPASEEDRANPIWTKIDAAVRNSPKLGVAGIVLNGHLALFVDSGTEGRIRVLAIPDDDIVETLESMAANTRFSEAEVHVVKQIVSGLGLSEAARQDGVSHETRRSQYKAVTAKIDAHSQNDLVCRILSRLLARKEEPVRPPANELFVQLARKYISQARTFLLYGQTGTGHRFIDIGPLDGRPVLFLHSQVLSDFSEDSISALGREKIRLIIPLRGGALDDSGARLNADAHLAHTFEAIDVARLHFFPGGVDLVGYNSGAAYALEYAKHHPRNIRTAGFIAAPLSADYRRGIDGTARRMRNAILELAARNWHLYSALMDFIAKRLRDPTACYRFIRERYQPNSPDLAMVHAEYSQPHGGERARKYLVTSFESFKHDYLRLATVDWQSLQWQAFPAAFFHGDADHINPINGIRRLAADAGDLPVHIIQGAGQLFHHSHFNPLIASYRAYLDAAEAQ